MDGQHGGEGLRSVITQRNIRHVEGRKEASDVYSYKVIGSPKIKIKDGTLKRWKRNTSADRNYAFADWKIPQNVQILMFRWWIFFSPHMDRYRVGGEGMLTDGRLLSGQEDLTPSRPPLQITRLTYRTGSSGEICLCPGWMEGFMWTDCRVSFQSQLSTIWKINKRKKRVLTKWLTLNIKWLLRELLFMRMSSIVFSVTLFWIIPYRYNRKSVDTL